MAVRVLPGPAVRADTIEFRIRGRGDLAAVALAHELERPRRVPFERARGSWRLSFPRPDADRMEYLLGLTRRDGSAQLVPDPANPLRAPGPFGDKSVVELPGYAPPPWVDDDESPAGTLAPLRLRSRRFGRIEATLWSAPETDLAEPLPLLLVHDGPEYAEYSLLLRLLDHLVAFGELPPLRAALLPPPFGERDDAYSASSVYARSFARELLPAILAAAPTGGRRVVGVGASLGALALLHLHWARTGLLGGLFLQSGSYFRRRSDRQERHFPRFDRISRFVGVVLRGRGEPEHVPVTVTSGTVEENRENNRAVAAALQERGWDARLVEHRDAHNWISWRDSLHPHLAELCLRAWA